MTIGLFAFVGGSLLYFIIPQWSLHQLLNRAKGEILNHFKDSYEATKDAYIQKLAAASATIEEENLVSTKELDLLIRRMELLKIVVVDTEEVPPWPYDLDQLLRLMAAGTLPFILILLERILATLQI